EARKKLPDLRTLGVQGGDVYLVFLTQFSADTSLVAYADQRKISERGSGRGGAGELMFDFEGEEKIDFKTLDGELKYFLPVDFAFMEEGSDEADEANRRRIKRRFLSTAQGNFILAGVPLRWIEERPPGTIVFDPTVQKSISGDTYIENYSTSSNYGSSSSLYFGINGMGITFRTLLKFNLSGIPAEALVSSATLKLYVYSLENAGSYQYSLHRVTTDWVENEATWQRPKNGAPNWNGGSYESTSLYTRTVSSTGWNYWYNLGDLVQDWLRGTVANDGLLLKGVNEGQSYSVRKAYSSEQMGLNPELHVSYKVPKTVYYLKDHLGSTRVVVDEDGDVVESYDYYPFGLASRTSGGSTIYKFTEKELDNETDFYYFGARYYDPEVGRWLSVDPLAEKNYWLSPYVYCRNNPISRIDPDGAEDKEAAFWAILRTAGGAFTYASGWALQLKGAALIAGSAGTLSPAGVMMILGGEGLKLWGAVEFGLGISDFQLAMSVPDGTDAKAIGNLAYEVAKAHGIKGSKAEIIGFIADAIVEGPSMAKNMISAKNIDLLKALISDATLTNDIKNIFEEIIIENNNRQEQRNIETEEEE
ncbi:MAG: DNRLRE domain-containing protein, partial [Candidatus Marinimicrobia bacterium]|nr:DNRLRE domain-containing protein [Candidatus Neomarinimicrobiota bacterium]